MVEQSFVCDKYYAMYIPGILVHRLRHTLTHNAITITNDK